MGNFWYDVPSNLETDLLEHKHYPPASSDAYYSQMPEYTLR